MNNIEEEANIKILYDHYMENDATDTGEIQCGCEVLDRILCELPISDHDRVWDISMKLCVLHEQRGFNAGFRMGLHLARKLQIPGQRRDS